METSDKSRDKALLKIAEKLEQAQKELDEMVLQFSLGKLEAKETFEKVKKEFGVQISSYKQSSLGLQVQGLAGELKSKIEELESLLDQGKAESKEFLRSRRKG